MYSVFVFFGFFACFFSGIGQIVFESLPPRGRLSLFDGFHDFGLEFRSGKRSALVIARLAGLTLIFIPEIQLKTTLQTQVYT